MKHFVLDTNVLLHDPRAIFQFEDNEVVIPIFVIEEIDSFKKEASERGRNAREVARMLDAFRASGARLSDGVRAAEGGGKVRVASAARSVPTTLRESQIADHLILRSRSTSATRTRTSRRSSSPRTSTCASAPTRWA